MNDDKRQRRTDQQKSRRLSSRVCGRCGGQPAEMMAWGGSRIAICPSCRHRLENSVPPESPCGHCGNIAESLKDWGLQKIPICTPCRQQLAGWFPRWGDLQKLGYRCSIDSRRPCWGCILPEPEPRQQENESPLDRIAEWFFK